MPNEKRNQSRAQSTGPKQLVIRGEPEFYGAGACVSWARVSSDQIILLNLLGRGASEPSTDKGSLCLLEFHCNNRPQMCLNACSTECQSLKGVCVCVCDISIMVEVIVMATGGHWGLVVCLMTRFHEHQPTFPRSIRLPSNLGIKGLYTYPLGPKGHYSLKSDNYL